MKPFGDICKDMILNFDIIESSSPLALGLRNRSEFDLERAEREKRGGVKAYFH